MITEATRKCEVVAGQVCGGFGEPGEVDQVGESRECFDLGCGQYSTGDEGGGDSGDPSLIKKVRVVATVDYYLVR
jgi:hypothetical protein